MNRRLTILIMTVSILASLALPAFATDVILNVPFLKQLWNNDTCGKGSCGPASVTMCGRYVYGLSGANGTPTIQDMQNIWSYLGGDIDGNNSNGTSLDQLVSASHNYFHIPNVYRTTSTLANVKSEIAAGKPVLVHVQASFLTNRGYGYTGGHYIVAVGYNNNYLICNDPGTYLGEHKYYSNSDMINAMNAKGCGVLKGYYNPVAPPPTRPDPGSGIHLQYVPYIQDTGWQTWVADGVNAGTIGKRFEGFAMYSPSTTVSYRSYVTGYGWQNWVSNGALAGTTGISKQMEAVAITVGSGYSVSYQAYVQGSGWTSVVSNGAVAGTTGQSKRLEALRVWITDTAAPVITSINLGSTKVAKGDTVTVTASVTDNVGVTGVTANGTPLTPLATAYSWGGSIAADTTFGIHEVTIIASDAAGNQISNSSKTYRTAEVVGINGRGIKDFILRTATEYYFFTVWGKVENAHTSYFDIDDGSKNKIRINAPGYTGISELNYIAARGTLNPTASPITLTCDPVNLKKYK